MRTKTIIAQRFKKVASNDTVYFNIPEYVYFVHRFPYKRLHSKNAIYHYLCQFLQPGTNMLALISKGDVQPVTLPVLMKMTAMKRKTFIDYFYILMGDGIIMLVNSGGLKRYYMNPAFAIAGDHLSQFFLDMWKVSGNRLIGEHMFAKNDELYKDNRNKNQRFGYLRDKKPYTEREK